MEKEICCGERCYRAIRLGPMKSRSVRQISLAGLSLFLLYVFLFSTSANAPSPFSRELKNVPLDDMVWRFIYGVRDCLKTRTDYLETRVNPFQEYWRRLPAIADSCGVNPQMSVRAYSTSRQFHFFFIPNMNKATGKENCQIVSYIGEKFGEVEARITRDNPNCAVFNSELSGREDWRDVFKRTSRVTALYIEPTPEDVRGLLDLLSSGDTLPICQINLLYPEPSTRIEPQFVADFNRLLTDGKYLLLEAEKDFSSTFINLFLVNFSDEFCRSRYFRMYTFD